MTREEAFEFLKSKLKNQNLIKHCLATEAIMRGLAKYFNEDVEEWGLAGLLHDIDYEETKNNPDQHSLVGAKMLEEKGLNTKIVQAVKVHNEAHGIPPESLMDKALFCTDPLTGLIVAATLVLPSKKLGDLTVDSVLKRFKEKRFAAGANREIMSKCQEYLNLSLEEFVKIGLEAMQGIAQDVGL